MPAMPFALGVRYRWDRVEPRNGRSSPVADISAKIVKGPLLLSCGTDFAPRCRYAALGTGRVIIKSV